MDRDTGGKRRRNKKGRMTSGLAALVWLLSGVCAAAVVCGGPGAAGLTAFTAFADVHDLRRIHPRGQGRYWWTLQVKTS